MSRADAMRRVRQPVPDDGARPFSRPLEDDAAPLVDALGPEQVVERNGAVLGSLAEAMARDRAMVPGGTP